MRCLLLTDGITVGGLHLENAAGDLEDRDIEGSTTEIVHGDSLALLLHARKQAETRADDRTVSRRTEQGRRQNRE